MIDYATANADIKASYSLYASNGVLQSANSLLPNATTHVDMKNMPAGVYIVQLQTSDGISSQKVVKL